MKTKKRNDARKFQPGTFGKTGFRAGRLGLGSSYGVGAKPIEEAFERGVNYFYWGWKRSPGMGEGLRKIMKKKREKVFVTVNVVVPTRYLLRRSVTNVLKALKADYIDGMHFFLMSARPPGQRRIESALMLKEEGLVRNIGFSSHVRKNFAHYHNTPFCDFFHVRYNAKHRGAQEDVFPHIPPRGDAGRPGVVVFTATSRRQLMKAKDKKPGGLPTPTAGDCYRFVMSNPDVDVCITGPANMAETRHALEALEKGPMTDEELEWMRQVGDRIR